MNAAIAMLDHGLLSLAVIGLFWHVLNKLFNRILFCNYLQLILRYEVDGRKTVPRMH